MDKSTEKIIEGLEKLAAACSEAASSNTSQAFLLASEAFTAFAQAVKEDHVDEP